MLPRRRKKPGLVREIARCLGLSGDLTALRAIRSDSTVSPEDRAELVSSINRHLRALSATTRARRIERALRGHPVSNPVELLLEFFVFEHLPPHLQEISRPIAELARLMAASLPVEPETTVGMRKLLEAKDCFVRARVRSQARG